MPWSPNIICLNDLEDGIKTEFRINSLYYGTRVAPEIIFFSLLEQFSTKCLKTKTKEIILAITNDVDNPVIQSKLEANTCS